MSEFIVSLCAGLLLLATHVIVWMWGYAAACNAWAAIANTGKFIVWDESEFRVQYNNIDHELDKCLRNIPEEEEHGSQ